MRCWQKIILCGIAAVLSGCASLQETTAYYTPTTSQVYPPLPKGAEVPVLSASPSWPYKVIGKFVTQSDRGYPFLRKALVYNARLQGADAVIVRRLAFDLRRTYNYIPPAWENVPVTNYFYQTIKNKHGNYETVAQPYTTFMPIFRPARTVVADVQWTDIEAEMIVRKGKPAWSDITGIPNVETTTAPRTGRGVVVR